MKYLLFFWALLPLCASAHQIKPDTRENSTPAIARAIDSLKQQGGGTLSLPKGRYDLWPQHAAERNYHQSNTTDIMPQRIGILIENAEHITLEGNGSTFVLHDRMMIVAIDHSKNIVLKNFSADWDIPLSAEAHVVAVDTTGFTARIDTHQFPFELRNNRLLFVGEGWSSPIFAAMEFRPDGLLRQETGDVTSWGYGAYTVRQLEPDLVRFDVPQGKPLPEAGNTLVLRHSARDHAGIFVQNSSDVTLDKVVLHHTAGLGVLCQYSENLTMIGSGVYPNAAKNRVLSGHDDGFHFMGCRGAILIDSCRWKGLMDDPINIHGTCVQVVEVLDPQRVVCRFMQHQSVGMVWGGTGDTVGFINPRSMRTLAHGVMKECTRRSVSDFEVLLSAPLPEGLGVGTVFENLSRTPHTVTIRNSRFESGRARGLLISAPSRVVIENNYFASSGSAILIAGDANDWYESGAVRDVLIRGNEFDAPCMSSMYQFCQAIISIEPEIPAADPLRPFHANIRIEGNIFRPFDHPILYAKSVDGLTFKDNLLVRSELFAPFHWRKAGITLDGCLRVEVGGNRAQGDVLGRQIELRHMVRRELRHVGPDFFERVRAPF